MSVVLTGCARRALTEARAYARSGATASRTFISITPWSWAGGEVAKHEPQRGRNDADAHRRVTGFEALQSGHGDTHAFGPGFQRLLAPQASHGQVSAKLFDGGSGGRRKLLKRHGLFWAYI